MSENIIEIVNADYTFEIEQSNYEISVENIFSIDYDFAVNKPSINNIVLKGNKTLSALGIQPSGNYADNNLSNLSASGQALLDNKSDTNLSNLSVTGESHFANPSLSNLNSAGNAVISALANTDLSNLSAMGQNIIDSKADKATTLSGYGITDGVDTNVSNLSVTGKKVVSWLAMPSNTFEYITIGASGASYIAPYSGYIVAFETSTAAAYSYLLNTTTSGVMGYATAAIANIDMYLYIPVKVGDVFTFIYNFATPWSLKMVKAVGEE